MNNEMNLTPRKESTRNAWPSNKPPLIFSLEEIKKHFDDSFKLINNQFDTADKLLKDNRENECKNIWRSQIVFLEGILDFYLHEMTKYCLLQMFDDRWKKSEKYKSLTFSLEEIEEALLNGNNNDWFLKAINKKFSCNVFLSKENMKDQLNLIGIGFEETIEKAFNYIRDLDSKKKKDIITELYSRRNTIAHQLDRNHFDAKQKDITKDFVKDYAFKINKIVEAIHSIALEKTND